MRLLSHALDDNHNYRGNSYGVAFGEVVGCGTGTFLSCIPGRLDYFVDEDQHWLLEK